MQQHLEFLYHTFILFPPRAARYLGCYKDNGRRDFKHGPKKYGYNVATCAKACKGYKYFALQNHRGWCQCDNSYGT